MRDRGLLFCVCKGLFGEVAPFFQGAADAA